MDSISNINMAKRREIAQGKKAAMRASDIRITEVSRSEDEGEVCNERSSNMRA